MRRMFFAGLVGFCLAGLSSAEVPSEPVCAAGDRKACFETGTAYAEGNGVEASMNAAIPFFLRACDRGMPQGCTTAGLAILDGAGDLEPNLEAGMHILEAGCTRGDDKGCESTVGYLTAQDNPMADTGRVVDVLIQGCKTGSMWACGWGARAAQDGYGGKYPEMADISKAAIIGEMGCEKGNLSACVLSETLFGDPSSALFDAEKSLEYSEVNCDSDIAESCNNLARVYYMINELELGTVAYERACELGMEQTCAEAKSFRAYLTAKAEYDAAEAGRAATINGLINAGRYGEAVNTAIYQMGSANQVEAAVRAAAGAGAMSSVNTQDLYVVASWFSSGEVRQIADAEMAARGTGLEGTFGTGTNTAGAADARWKELYGSSIPTTRTSSPAAPSTRTFGAGDAAAQVRDKYRTAHCEMAGSNASAAVCRN